MNRRQSSGLVFGVLLILAGGIWLVSNIFKLNIDFSVLWPLFILVPGLMWWVDYLVKHQQPEAYRLLIPANILTFLGLTFFTNVLVDRYLNYNLIWAWTVFMYPGSVAIAFWIAWLFSAKKKALLVPATILTFISAMLLCVVSVGFLFSGQSEITKYIWPLMLICGGVFILSTPLWQKSFPESKRSENHNNTKQPASNPSNEVQEAELVDAAEVDRQSDSEVS